MTGAALAVKDGVQVITCTGALNPSAGTESKQLKVGDTVKYKAGFAGYPAKTGASQ